MLFNTTNEQTRENRRGLVQFRFGQAVMPVEHFDRILGQAFEHDVLAVQMEHVEAGLALERLEDFKIVAATELLVFFCLHETVRGHLGGKKETVSAAIDSIQRKADGDLGDDPERMMQRLRRAAHIGKQFFRSEFAGRGQRAEDRLQDRHFSAQGLCRCRQRLVLPTVGTLTHIQGAQAQPVLGTCHARLDDFPGAIGRSPIDGHRAPVLNAIGTGRHELEQVKIPFFLPGQHVGGQLVRIQILVGIMPPHGDRHPIRLFSENCCLQPLPMIHFQSPKRAKQIFDPQIRGKDFRVSNPFNLCNLWI